jgi:hypothetical protein
MRVKPHRHCRRLDVGWLFVALLLLAGLAIMLAPSVGRAQTSETRLQIYGHAMLDMGYQAKQNDPAWFDVVRPTKLPSFENQFGEDGHFFSGVRQSRFGVKSFTPTDLGELRTTFEFELFGTGGDAGQTTFRLRHAYGELGKIGAGQTWSPFMDIDVFPNSLEYWGPNGMVFFRNVQVRWMPVQGDTRVTIALERPGASGDAGDYSDYTQVTEGIKGRFPLPDLSAEYRVGRDWGYVELAGILRQIKWDDVMADSLELGGDALGWGVNLSSNLKIKKDTIRLQAVYGEGIENYMNDATVDIGLSPNTGSTSVRTPVQGEPLPILGIVAFYDRTWNDKWTSSAGYSRVDIDNTHGQTDDAFHVGEYALVNLLYYPTANVMLGPEFQWGRRENFRDGWSVVDYRVQFSFKYNFSYQLGGV